MSKKENRPKVLEKTRTLLWMKSGGRCQFDNCNKPLWKHDVTMAKMNKAYIAHIYAYSPKGPRYQKDLSKELEVAFENLMLVCDECHRIFDDMTRVEEYSANRLIKMKQDHEDRIERLTAIHPSKKSHILLYGASIRGQISPLSYAVASNTIVPDYYPDEDRATTINLQQTTFKDKDETYWTIESQHLISEVQRLLEYKRKENGAEHYSVFGLAPIPLLIQLGCLLSEISNCEVYQLSKEPKTWKWQVKEAFDGHLVQEPQSKIANAETNKVVLKIELSAIINDNRIHNVLGDECEIWSISHSKPHNDYLKDKSQLEDFKKVMRQTYAMLRQRYGDKRVIHVFPAMPVSTAIEMGRVRAPKADLPLTIYDQNEKEFIKAIEIC